MRIAPRAADRLSESFVIRVGRRDPRLISGPLPLRYATRVMAPFKARRTLPGHVPSAWLRPHRSAAGWLLAVVLLYAGFLLIVRPDVVPLQPSFIYRPGELAESLGQLDRAGRDAYRLSLLIELGFAVVYGAFFRTWLRFLKVRGTFPRWVVPSLALVAPLLDFVENGSLLLAITSDSGATPWLWATVIATPLKWVAIIGTLALLVWGEARHYQRRHLPR